MKYKAIIIIGVGLIIVCTASYFYWRSKVSMTTRPVGYSDAVITLKRTACFGTCPAYILTIYGDGRVAYEGEKFVKVTGKQITQISPTAVRELVDEFYQTDFFSLKDEYTASITDLPTTETSITIDRKTKKVVDYFGAPEKLKKLEDKIDEVVNSKVWVGK